MYDKRNKMENICLILSQAFLRVAERVGFYFHFVESNQPSTVESRFLQRLKSILSLYSLIYQTNPINLLLMRVIRRPRDININ